MKTIGIVGSRRRSSANDFILLLAAFDNVWQPGDRIVSGGCEKGGDDFAWHITKARGLTITVHFPDWSGPSGKLAGIDRNTSIAEDCDVLLALVAANRKGGTEDTIKKVEQLGKEVILL